MYFQNPFTADYQGSLVLGDRHFQPTFVCPRHTSRTDTIVASHNGGIINFATTDGDGTPHAILRLGYSYGADDFRNWSVIAVDVTTQAASATAVTPDEFVASVMANSLFNSQFVAEVSNGKIIISQKGDSSRMRFYVVNGGAEEKLRFNAKAGVAELPSYFDRHTIARRRDFPDSVGMLVLLDPANSAVDHAVVAGAFRNNIAANFDPDVVQADWQLLRGRSGLFQFTKTTGGTKIVYPAGAREGDFAMMIIEGAGERYELPYTLTADDLIVPTLPGVLPTATTAVTPDEPTVTTRRRALGEPVEGSVYPGSAVVGQPTYTAPVVGDTRPLRTL